MLLVFTPCCSDAAYYLMIFHADDAAPPAADAFAAFLRRFSSMISSLIALSLILIDAAALMLADFRYFRCFDVPPLIFFRCCRC